MTNATHIKYCSDECRKKVNYDRKLKYKLICKYCKKEFNSYDKKRKFCSQECYKKSRFGKKYTKSWRDNISKALTGYKHDTAFKIMIGKRRRGKKNSEESKIKTSKSLIAAHKKKKWGFAKEEFVPWNKGIKGLYKGIPRHAYDDNFRKKISAYAQDIEIEKWNKFTSFEPYDDNFTKKFKRSIMKRDICCVLCGKISERMAVHHIDYDKKNTNIKNCLLLCPHCHIKTNSNRKYWTTLFKKYIGDKYVRKSK